MSTLRYWQAVLDADCRVPQDRSLTELTTELVTMLGDPDPQRRDGLACAVLLRWLAEGVFDDVLAALGDGVSAGLRTGLGEDGTDTVFRRSCSAVVLARAVHRDNDRNLLTDDAVLRWGDRAATWYVRERDLRGTVPGKGGAHCLAHGADVIGALARSRRFGTAELEVLLDVVTERLAAPSAHRWQPEDTDRLAYAVLTVLHRGLVPGDRVTEWVGRLGRAAEPGSPSAPGQRENRPAADGPATRVYAFLHALHAQLLLGVRGRPDVPGDAELFGGTPPARADVVLAVQAELRAARPALFAPVAPRPD